MPFYDETISYVLSAYYWQKDYYNLEENLNEQKMSIGFTKLLYCLKLYLFH